MWLARRSASKPIDPGMLDNLVGIPLPWTDGSGFALKDVNATNFRYLNHFMENNRAQSVADYDRAQRRFQGGRVPRSGKPDGEDLVVA